MKLLEFINKTPTAFHAAANVRDILLDHGYKELYECEAWEINKGGRYFTTRNGSSIIAFSVPENEYNGIMVCASHTDSPSLKIKSNLELPPVNGIIRLNVEGYGGMIRESWFDRPLSVAGRIAIKTGDEIEEKLINIDRELLVIPSLAIHMGKPRNDDKVNIQTELLPILRTDKAQTDFMKLIAEAANTEPESVTGCDLCLYNREKGVVFGAENEFIASGRIDNLESVYLSLNAFLNSDGTNTLKIFAAFDNEETGSLTRQGAESTFFSEAMERVNEALDISRTEYMRRLASSFILSIDNAHAGHPNYPGKADPANSPRLNGGVVIKYNASGRYTTDAVSAAAVKLLAERACVPIQEYHNRSDIAGGSTLGNLMNRHISVHCADIGLAQLAMHSVYETAGAKDAQYMESLLHEFYSSEIKTEKNGKYSIIKAAR
ncbi:MAG: M18 family aminopeptidase [Oscillospiraceae bacterium]|nr:M18 family aminopeptidase [Oscillospiraceae bacterium]